MKKTFFLLTGVLFVLLFLGCPNATETPKSNDARLQSLEVSEGSLSPPFAEDIFDYTVTVPNSVTSLTVTGEKADAFATMTPSDGKLSFTNLSVGTSDEQTIKVTAEDGTTIQEYKVKVLQKLLEMVLVPPGSFQRDGTEINISVITKPYYLGKYPITRQQFEDVMGRDPSYEFNEETDESLPVQMVNWYHAIAFCNKLSLLEGLTPAYTVSRVSNWAELAFDSIPTSTSDANYNAWKDAECNWDADGYRLPTEMEWMWAAMGAPADGQDEGINRTGYTKAYAGAGTNSIGDYAWYDENSDDKTHPVGGKRPNELGLYDMSGNVEEWCWDWDNPQTGKRTDDRGVSSGSYRVVRGGSWHSDASFCTVASRNDYSYIWNDYFPYNRRNYRGFRVLRPVLQGLRASTSVSKSCAKAQQAKHEGERERRYRSYSQKAQPSVNNSLKKSNYLESK